LREKLTQMQANLRDIQCSIEQDKIKNENLKKVELFEGNLRVERNKEELSLLTLASTTQDTTFAWTKNVKAHLQEEDKLVV
jgi:hypothetical protein